MATPARTAFDLGRYLRRPGGASDARWTALTRCNPRPRSSSERAAAGQAGTGRRARRRGDARTWCALADRRCRVADGESPSAAGAAWTAVCPRPKLRGSRSSTPTVELRLLRTVAMGRSRRRGRGRVRRRSAPAQRSPTRVRRRPSGVRAALIERAGLARSSPSCIEEVRDQAWASRGPASMRWSASRSCGREADDAGTVHFRPACTRIAADAAARGGGDSYAQRDCKFFAQEPGGAMVAQCAVFRLVADRSPAAKSVNLQPK